jgi:hypothetical protein
VPFKKRKQAKQARENEVQNNRFQVEKQFDVVIQKAAEGTDPAEKVIALSKISSDITNQIWRENHVITRKVRDVDEKASVATAWGALAVYGTVGGLVLSAAIPPVAIVALPASLVGIGVSKIISSKHAASVGKNLKEASKEHIKNMEDLKALVAVMTDVAIENNAKEISQSPLNVQIRALPGIADKFAEAMVKHIAETSAAAEVPKPEPSAPQSRKKPVFKSITNALGSN